MNVYIIASEGGMCKVGKANDPSARMAALATGHPYKLMLAHVFPTTSDTEAYAVEQRAHSVLASKRMSGEWFNVTIEEAIAAVDPTYSPPEDWDRWNRHRLASASREVANVLACMADQSAEEMFHAVRIRKIGKDLARIADGLIAVGSDDDDI